MIIRTAPTLRGSTGQADKIPDTFVREIVEQTSLVDLIGAHVKLKKSGASFLGLCPFHSEKGPSFTVSEDKHFYHCFGCGKHGDAVKFLRDYAGMNFREAVTELAEKLGRPIPSSAPGAHLPAPAPTAPLYARIDLAYKFFRHCLRHTEKPKQYLRERGVNAESLKRFSIGYAPEGWQSLKEAFPEYEKDHLLIELGLIKTKEERAYDGFRDRLIFSIRDPRGRIIGFGGRSFDDNSPPKYLNSPASQVFDKGSVLFGVYEAKAAIQSTKQVIVVEGYMDVVMLSQYGIENVVASMGTACTEDQIERLCALAPEVIFTFDGDNAGLEAAWRAMKNCLPFAKEERVFRFCLLDQGKDPDDIVRAEGKDAFLRRTDAAMPLSAFVLSQLAKRNNSLATPEDKARFLNAGMELIRKLPYGSHLYRIMRDELSRAANVGMSEVLAVTSRPVLRKYSKDEAYWDNLLKAITRWPQIAKDKVEEVINKLTEDDFQELQDEKFSCQTEQMFWETFLSLPEVESPQPTASEESDEAEVHKDLVHNIATVISRYKERARRSKISSQYRQGLITEEQFIKTRQMMAA